MPVTTRSQSKCDITLSEDQHVNNLVIYDVNIDFDEASAAWKSNKRRIGDGCYRYVCAKKGKHNNECTAKCSPGLEYCRTHYNMFLKGKL